jgi:uncharacterized BrkB/YihY/UPF0761 family membrane protein
MGMNAVMQTNKPRLVIHSKRERRDLMASKILRIYVVEKLRSLVLLRGMLFGLAFFCLPGSIIEHIISVFIRFYYSSKINLEAWQLGLIELPRRLLVSTLLLVLIYDMTLAKFMSCHYLFKFF